MMQAIRTSSDSSGLLFLFLDTPGKPVNTCSQELLDELSLALDAIEQHPPRALVVASDKPASFCAGGDLYEMRSMTPEQVSQYLARGQTLFNRIARLPIPTVAAINGDCLGGGTELALACRYRVAADNPAIVIGLPEVKLGLIPAWGGSTRLPRLLGLTKALPILLAGKTFPPQKARKIGLIDQVVAPEALLSAARRIADSAAAPHQPRRLDRVIAAVPLLRRRVLNRARAMVTHQGGTHYPGPFQIIDAVAAGYDRGFDAGLEAERRGIVQAIDTETGRNLMRLFFLRQRAKRRASSLLPHPSAEIRTAAVIGGGTMGAGIAHALVRAGIFVRLVEVDGRAASAALTRIRRLLDDDVAAGRLAKLAARDAFHRVAPATDYSGLKLPDIVIEAVVEELTAKCDVFARLDRTARVDIPLASNTSSLRIRDIARATAHPQRVVGMHFFNPVPKMPLVEVVAGPLSDDDSVATAMALAVRIGKLPILVHDAPGFLVNRLLVPYLAEALTMLGEGIDITAIDAAARDWGMPMGPFELLDEIGLDIAAHVVKTLSPQPHRAGAPDSTTPALSPSPCNQGEGRGGGSSYSTRLPDSTPSLTLPLSTGRGDKTSALKESRDADTQQPENPIETAVAHNWLGRKTGRGFYIYNTSRRVRRLVVNRELLRHSKLIPASNPGAEGIAWRLILPMVNEAARCVEEGIVETPEAVDLATVLGLGLAPFRGGLVRFAQSVGLADLTKHMNDLAQKLGPRFAPAAGLAELIEPAQPVVPVNNPTGRDERPLLDDARDSFVRGGSHAHLHT